LRDSATIGVEQNSRRHRKIAARHQLASRRRRHALDRRHHRLRQLHDGLHHGAAGGHDLRKIGAPVIGVAAAGGEFLHVVAGGKGRAVGCEHHRAHACIVVNIPERGMQFGDQAFRQAVARLRPVEGQHRDAAHRLAQEN
jgi:hypothetical protein